MPRFVLTLLALFTFSHCGTQNKVSVNEEATFTTLFAAGDKENVACYRIPALLRSDRGTLIAAVDERVPSCGDLRSNKDINIVIRTSNDNGSTWSKIRRVVDYPLGESASDPSFILDRTSGEIFMFFNYMDLEKAPGEYRLQSISSTDEGRSWSAPVDVTPQITKPEWRHDFQFITSGKGVQLENGMLLHTLVNLDKGLHLFGSRDHGKSWFLIDTPIMPGDESKVVELADGRWMINSRVNNSGLRYVHLSDDEGTSWTSRPDSILIDPGCNASLIRYPSDNLGRKRNALLFANAFSADKRENLSVHISHDEGVSWTKVQSIYPASSAYSSLCLLDRGEVGVFFEKDDYRACVFTRFGLE